jgi:F-type H+-transporting ATPase subunit c
MRYSPERSPSQAERSEPQPRLFTPFLITVGLVEAVYFINVAFMALFVFATPDS